MQGSGHSDHSLKKGCRARAIPMPALLRIGVQEPDVELDQVHIQVLEWYRSAVLFTFS